MFDVTIVKGNVWRVTDDDDRYEKVNFEEPLRRRLLFDGSPVVFDVHGREEDGPDGRRYQFNVSVDKDIPSNQIVIDIKYAIFFNNGIGTGERVRMSGNKATPNIRPVFFKDNTHVTGIRFTLDKVIFKPFFFATIATVDSYFDRGPIATLVASDGVVSVPRRQLERWSSAFEAMLNHDTVEKMTGQIKMEDLDTRTLIALKQYMMTGKIVDGEETALGLILLGDMYGVQGMKEAAEFFVKHNIERMDKEEVWDIYSRLNRNLYKDRSHMDAMFDSPCDPRCMCKRDVDW